jgi:hypothetical protein
MQKTYPLSQEMAKNLEAKRTWVKDHYAPESKLKYDTVEGKLHLLDTIIKSGWIEKDETLKLQCLGVTLGDAFAQDLSLEWIEVKDEFGNDPALKLPNTSIIIYPLTMVSKRIEDDEKVNIYELYSGLKKKIEEIRGPQ